MLYKCCQAEVAWLGSQVYGSLWVSEWSEWPFIIIIILVSNNNNNRRLVTLWSEWPFIMIYYYCSHNKYTQVVSVCHSQSRPLTRRRQAHGQVPKR